jgi:hypothetical protein
MANKQSTAEFKKSLNFAAGEASIAMEGFERIRALLEAIKHLAAASDQDHIVTIAREAVRVAYDYHNIADCDREAFELAAAEVDHG